MTAHSHYDSWQRIRRRRSLGARVRRWQVRALALIAAGMFLLAWWGANGWGW